MLGKRFVLFELLGFKVQVDASWLFLAMLVTWSLATGVFPFWYEGLSAATYWWMALVGMFGLFSSLIFHEMSHSLVARHFGLPIRGIVLFIFGGVAEMEEEPASPKAEFLMAVAGPVASGALALGFFLLTLAAMASGLPAPVLGVLDYLSFINGLIAVFNLLPGFPLDGGRMLRAALWHFKGDLREATRIASRSGEIFAMVLMALGAVNVVAGNFLGGMWWFLIGLFLYGAARASFSQLLTRRAFEGETVRRFMTPDPITVGPDLTLDAFVEGYLYRSHHGLYPVVDDRCAFFFTVRRQSSLAYRNAEAQGVPQQAAEGAHWKGMQAGVVGAPNAQRERLGAMNVKAMSDWNVVISVHEHGYKRARELLESFGKIEKTIYYNVLVMTVDDTGAFLERLAKLTDIVPDVLTVLSRVVPAARTFTLQNAAEFEAKAREVVLAWAPKLANKSFYVRLYRRGLKGRISSPEEERFLDEVLLDALEKAKTPGRISFEDPDVVIDVEIVGNRAGMSIWTREDLSRYPFLKVS